MWPCGRLETKRGQCVGKILHFPSILDSCVILRSRFVILTLEFEIKASKEVALGQGFF